MQDLRFLALCGLVTSSLIIVNKPLFLKSFSSSQLANHQIKQAAQQIELEGFYQAESEFWNNIKEIDRKTQVIAKSSDSELKKSSSKTNHTSPKKSINQTTASINQSKSDSKSVIYSVQMKPDNTTNKELEGESSINDLKSSEIHAAPLEKQESAKRILLLGDSIMYFIGVAFENGVKKSDYNLDKIKVFSKISTGLNRIDFYDWYARTRELIQETNPDTMVVVFGGNDSQHILDVNKKLHAELTPEWEKAYEERVERYAKLLDEYPVRKVYWIGHPMSNVARYNKFFPIFNRIYKKVSQAHPKIEFIDYWDTFAKNGKFLPMAADRQGRRARVRYNDGLHPTEHGAKIMVEILKEKMLKDGILQPKIETNTTNN